MTSKRLKECAATLLVVLGWLFFAPAAMAANCSIATSQGSTGPSGWQTYCWIDFSTYNDTTARSGSGQNFSLTLQDGTVMSFNLKVTSTAALDSVAAPSWSGAAIGNTAFLGIAGQPVLYQLTNSTSATITMSNIRLTPPPGATGGSQYMIVAADGESTNDGETLSFQTNGGNWVQLDQVGPITGSTYPTLSGIGTNTFTETGATGTVGAYIGGTSTPTTVTTTLVGGGLEGAMFAVRYASIRLYTQISGIRLNAADQFAFSINSTTTGTALAAGATSGTSLGPFTAAALATASAVPVTLIQSMASGSVSALTHYRSSLTCTNSAGSSTPLPSGVITSSYSFGALQYGDVVQCTYTEVTFPHLTLKKALAASGRQFSTDQFELDIDQGATNVATTTTTGTGATVTNGTTAQTQVAAGTAYTLYEDVAGTTVLNQYTATMACTNANAGSTTTLPSSPGGTITPSLGDIVTCTITNTKRAANAQLTILKSSTLVSDPVNGTINPKFLPGAIVRYTFTVANTGPSTVTNNSVWLIDTLPAQLRVGTSSSPIFTQGSPTSGLTFTTGTDIRYSSSATAPTTFAGCTYTPTSAYDAAVRFVCLNPKGTMAGSTGTPPSFTLSIQAQVN
ncbi:hypothetical protein GCM10009087_21320 [Sphingomonas oligophenolica]|uniref:SpaA-like prealbumin fold domain-containing protein n=1 Tax=Sphingomonas oligophenolica TaxID=301154 RepID=A0ABU9Y3Q8_9SPHN